MRFHLVIQRHGLPVTRILWTTSPSSLLGPRSGPSSFPHGGYTIAQLLEDLNELVPLETETGLFENESGGQWGLEDYVVEVGGYECLHFMEVDGLLRDGDEVVVRALQLADLRARRISGRHQISADGKHLIDGVPFGRPFLKRSVLSRPSITIPPRKKRRTLLSGWSGGMPNEEGDAEWAPRPEDSGKELALIPDEDADPVSESDADESDAEEDLTGELESLKEDLGPSEIHESMEAADQQMNTYSLRGKRRKVLEGSIRENSPSVFRSASEKSPAAVSPKVKSVRFNQEEDLPTLPQPKAEQPSSDVSMSSKSDLESSSVDTTSDVDSSDSEDEQSSSDEETSSESDEETSSDESVDIKSKRRLQPKVSAPGHGSAQTKKSNRRTKLRRRLKKLKDLGALPKEADFKELRMFDNSYEGRHPASSDKAQAEEQEQAEFEAKRQKLLRDLESGGVDIDATSEKENVPPDQDRKGDLADAQVGVAADAEAQPLAESPAEASAEPSKKRSLDVTASRRLLFGSLGVRTPRTKEDEEATRKKLAGKVRQFQPQEAEKEAEDAVESERDSEVDWEEKVILKATECMYDDIVLKDPTFPFEQRWDPDAWDMIRQRKGWGKKRKRSRKSYGYDGEMADEYQDSNDHYFVGDTELNYDDNVEHVNEVEDNSAAVPEAEVDAVPEDEADDLPLPDDISSAADLDESQVKKGSIIAFKQLDMSKATNWQPKVSEYRVATVHSDPEDGIFLVRLAKRDRRQHEEVVEDEEGNRQYSGFEMPGFEDEDDNGIRDLCFADFIEPKLLRAVDATQANKSVEAEPSVPSTLVRRHIDGLELNDEIQASPSSSLRFPLSSPPPAEILYHGKEDGTRDSRPIPAKGKKAWKLHPIADTASLGTRSVRRGDIVAVCLASGREGFAKISDMRRGDDGRHVFVYTWLYTRDEVVEEFREGGDMSERSRKYLGRMWPAEAPYKYMFSTGRIVTVWDHALKRASEEVTSQICMERIYNQHKRQIFSVDEPGQLWMKRILELEPPELPDQEAVRDTSAELPDQEAVRGTPAELPGQEAVRDIPAELPGQEAVRETPAEQVEQQSASPVVSSPSFAGFQSSGSNPASESGGDVETGVVNQDEGSDHSSKRNKKASQASKNQDIISSPKSHTSFDLMLAEFIQGSRQDRSSASIENQDGSPGKHNHTEKTAGNENGKQDRPRPSASGTAANSFNEAGNAAKEGGRLASEELQDDGKLELFSNPKSPPSHQPNGSARSSRAGSIVESGWNGKHEASQPPKSSQMVDIVDLTQESPAESDGEDEADTGLPQGPGWVQKNPRTRASTGHVQKMKEVSVSPPKVKRKRRVSE